MKTSKYFLYLASITALFFISMLMITIILIGLNSAMSLLGVPAGIIIAINLKPFIVDYIYGDQEFIHRSLDKLDYYIDLLATIITVVSLRFIFEKGDRPSYVLGEALWYTWLFTKYFIVGALLVQGIRYLFFFFHKGDLLELKNEELVLDDLDD